MRVIGVVLGAGVLVMHLLIARGKVASVGYNAALVVERGEWWRLLVAPACQDRLAEAVVVAGVLAFASLVGGVKDATFAVHCAFFSAAAACFASSIASPTRVVPTCAMK